MILALLLIASTQQQLQAELDRIIAGQDVLPSLAAVQAAAEEALCVASEEEASSWASRARWQGVLPQLQARFGTDRDLDVRDDGSSALRLTEAQGLGLQLSARFDLANLIFSDRELRASRERLARAAAVRLARERATKIYFDRVKVLLQLRAQPTPALLLEAARLDGLLRALTGGLLEEKR